MKIKTLHLTKNEAKTDLTQLIDEIGHNLWNNNLDINIFQSKLTNSFTLSTI